MSDDKGEFDLRRWLALSPKPSSCDCVREAADNLALGRGHIRSRLFDALVCIGLGDGSDIPEHLRSEFQAIRQEAQLRAGPEIIYDRLRKSISRTSVKTARRIARRIVALDRALTAQGCLIRRST